MGSDSDWPVMEAAAKVLDDFGIAYEVDVVSAHRMPDEMITYGHDAEERGLRVIIAGAGGAAHLPGHARLGDLAPVIGVPVPLEHLDGMDSLLSIVQMPERRPGRDGVGRGRPQRRPARRPHPRRRRGRRGGSAPRGDGRVPQAACATRRTPRARPCASAAHA